MIKTMKKLGLAILLAIELSCYVIFVFLSAACIIWPADVETMYASPLLFLFGLVVLLNHYSSIKFVKGYKK